jgi:hypothetical protein
VEHERSHLARRIGPRAPAIRFENKGNMKTNTLLCGGLFLAAILAQAGCGTAAQNSAASSHAVVLPEGTPLAVRTTGALSTNGQEAGQTFTGKLEQPLLQGGREIAAKSARVEGIIVDADKGGRVKGVASLTLRLTGLQAGGQFVEISTNTVTRSAGTTKRKDGTEIAIGAGVGAVIGAIAGGGKGAAIGSAAGGGAGTGVVLATRGDPAVIPDESLLTFTLHAPVTVTGP